MTLIPIKPENANTNWEVADAALLLYANEKRLSTKQLAALLSRSVPAIYAMKWNCNRYQQGKINQKEPLFATLQEAFFYLSDIKSGRYSDHKALWDTKIEVIRMGTPSWSGTVYAPSETPSSHPPIAPKPTVTTPDPIPEELPTDPSQPIETVTITFTGSKDLLTALFEGKEL